MILDSENRAELSRFQRVNSELNARLIESAEHYVKAIDHVRIGGHPLRPTQIQIAIQFLALLKIKKGRQPLRAHLVKPPGSGKTITAVMLNHMVSSRKTIFFVRNRSEGLAAIEEFKQHFSLMNLSKTVGQCFDKKIELEHSVVVATFQTLSSRWHRVNWSEVDLVFIDEADITGMSPRRYSKIKQLSENYFMPIIAMTATDTLASGLKLQKYYPDMLMNMPLPQSIKKAVEIKIINSTRFLDLSFDYDLKIDSHDVIASDLNPGQLNQALLVEAMNRTILENHQEHFRQPDGTYRPALIIYRNNFPIQDLINQIRKFPHFKAAFFTSKTPMDEREKLLEKFLRGEITFLCGSQLPGRGLNLPPLQLVYNATLTWSPQLFWQVDGRVFRVDPQNSEKIGEAICLLPRKIFCTHKDRYLAPEEMPLSHSTFFDANYYFRKAEYDISIVNSFYEQISGNRYQLKTFSSEDLMVNRSIAEIAFFAKAFRQKMELQQKIKFWKNYFKNELGLTALEWLRRYPDYASLQKDDLLGRNFFTQLELTSIELEVSKQYANAFSILYDLPLLEAQKMNWQTYLQEEKVFTPYEFFKRFPNVTSLEKWGGLKMLNELEIEHGEYYVHESYQKVFEWLFGVPLIQGKIYYWSEFFKKELKIDSVGEWMNIFKDHAAVVKHTQVGSKIFTDLGYPSVPQLFQKNLSLNNICTEYYRRTVEKLFNISYREAVKQKWLYFLKTKWSITSAHDWVTTFRSFGDFMAQKKVPETIFKDLDLIASGSRKQTQRPNQVIYENLLPTLFNVSFAEALKEKWLGIFEQKDIFNVEDFMAKYSRGNDLKLDVSLSSRLTIDLGIGAVTKQSWHLVYDQIILKLYGPQSLILEERLALRQRNQLFNDLCRESLEELLILFRDTEKNRFNQKKLTGKKAKALDVKIHSLIHRIRHKQSQIIKKMILPPKSILFYKLLRRLLKSDQNIGAYLSQLRTLLDNKISYTEQTRLLKLFKTYQNRKIKLKNSFLSRMNMPEDSHFNQMAVELYRGNMDFRNFYRFHLFRSEFSYERFSLDKKVYENSNVTFKDLVLAPRSSGPAYAYELKELKNLFVFLLNQLTREYQIVLIHSYGLFGKEPLTDEEITRKYFLAGVPQKRNLAIAMIKKNISHNSPVGETLSAYLN